LQKADEGTKGFLKRLALTIYVMALFSTVAVLPLGSFALLIDSDMSAFLPFWIALSLALAVSVLGYEQRTVAGWLGSSRVSAQAFAGAVPALLTLICVGIRAGSFKWSRLADSQSFSPLHWAIFSNPFQFLAFFIFLASGLILLSADPANSGSASPEIHGGVASDLTGFRGSLMRLSRYYAFFLWSLITAVMFLGGWKIPFQLHQALIENSITALLSALEILVLLSKTYFLMFIIVWMSKSTPRGRVDQVTNLSWKVLSPLALLTLVGSGFWAGIKALL